MGEVQLIEKTGKQWKKWKLIGALVCFLGGPASCAVTSSVGVGVLVYIVGMLMMGYGCFGGWWHHG